LGEDFMTSPPRTADDVAAHLNQGLNGTEPPEEAREESPPRILVVDDEEVVCRFLKRVLDGGRRHVEVSYGGAEAIARLEEDSFDLVITDLKMPGVDGIGVLSRAKQLDPLCEVIIITAYASVESAVEVMKLGAYDYISKPFNVDRIRLVVDKALEKRRLLQAAGERDFYKRLSQVDGLTEVYNRRALDELLAVEISRSDRFRRPLSLLMVDLDHLKVINDRLGHQAGDEVLKAVAWTLKTSVRNCDAVARYGGDEFAIILVETGKTDAMTTANRLSQLVRVLEGGPKGDLGDEDRSMTISIGVASYPTDGMAKDELIRSADKALYDAKAGGGDCVRAATP
jgi:two-component system cell cycle response regulator